MSSGPLHIDAERCTACGACVGVCPVQALELTGDRLLVDARCIACGACLPACPVQALSLAKAGPADAVAQHAGLWVWGEQQGDGWHPAVAELLAEAARLLPASHITVVAVGTADQAAARCQDLAGLPVDRLLWGEHPALDHHRDGAVAQALAALARAQRPAVVVAAASDRGRSMLPRLAALLQTGLTADCTVLDIDPASGDLLQTRPAFGGNIMATIRSARHRPQMATVRPGLFAPAQRDGSRPPPRLERQVIADALIADPLRVIACRVGDDQSGIADARRVVAFGRGVSSAQDLDLVQRFARHLGAGLAASRAAVEAGWASERAQVGQTGRSVHPDLYVALGISGAVQHLVGIAGARVVVAVNRDPVAPILDRADHAVIGDWRAVVKEWMALIPALTAPVPEQS